MCSPGIFFNVNGRDVLETTVDPELTLAYYLRNNLGLRGTKLGCEEGVCGSCTVVLGTWNPGQLKATYRAVNACLVPLFHVHRCFVITVEGVGSREKIHPIQDRMARGHALQCGFCSPGFVMSAYALLRTHPNPTIDQINSAIRANLCRCTGYRPILEALYSFSDGCCGGKSNGRCCQETDVEDKLLSFDDFPKYDSSQEIIFPPSLRLFSDSEMTVLTGPRIHVSVPKTLEQFQRAFFCEHPPIVISSGLITRLVTSSRPENMFHRWVSTRYVQEFNSIAVKSGNLEIGAACSVQELADALVEFYNNQVGSAVGKFVSQFSTQQVANFATWTGALFGKGVSDIRLLLAVLNARLTILKSSTEIVEIGLEEYLSEPKTQPILAAVFSKLDDTTRLFCFKLGETSEQDPTQFNFAALLPESGRSQVFVGLGGFPRKIESLEELPDELKGLKQFEVAVARFEQFRSQNQEKTATNFNFLQYFKPSENRSVGRPLANYFNERAITGEAIYVNDIKAHEALHLGFVLSSNPRAKIIRIDTSEALKLDGVVGYFGVEDVPGNNKPGLSLSNVNFPDDTTIFADGQVEAIGQIIGVIAAKDVVLARRAAKLVKVEYEPLPFLVDFKEARECNSLVGDVQHYGKTEEEVKKALEDSEVVLEGEADIGGQEHFYMETQSCLVVPGEGDELIVHSSTQATSFTHLMVAEVMKLAANKVIVKTKRLGGAFGGKVSSSSWIASIAAIVAKRMNRPVYGFLSRADDLISTGKRHPVFAKYRVGIDKSGKIRAAHHEVWLNGGWSKDHTEGVAMVIGVKIDDVYGMGAVRVDGFPVKTNTCSNTALRGYGNPQVKIISEGIMRRIAHETGQTSEEVKRANFAVQGDKNFLGGTIHNDHLIQCWEACRQLADFEPRARQVADFNRSSRHVKRGVAMSAVRFGLPHPGPTGHGIASLLINLDGSVQLSIGGSEMGQGLYQKMLQVCSESLKRPIETITIVDSSTDKVTNAPETGGSQNADTNGLAVMECCRRILDRLQPLIDKNEGDWGKAVREAFSTWVPLQCTEYGVTEREKFGVANSESPYTTSGACCVEVEVDTSTGFNRLLRADLVMDVGESLNPAIDIGQIEGAFMQGYGLVTCETVTFDTATGRLEQATARSYKIPKVKDVPPEFRVKLLGVSSLGGTQVYSSKGVGEPPLMMSCGAIHSAIMKCVDDWRDENEVVPFLNTVSPLNAKTITQLCSRK